MSGRAFSPAKPSAIDLFAGCGGLTQGLKDAGFDVKAAVEVASVAAEVYRLNHPEVTQVYCEDIRGLTGDRILRDLGMAVGELDLLAGCPPCQGFSRMRTLNKGGVAEDARNDLVKEYLRLVAQLQPKALMFENVPGLRQNERYHEIVRTVRDMGYFVEDEVHDAADFGVPQRRLRLILLGSKRRRPVMPAKCEHRVTVRDQIFWLEAPEKSKDEAQRVVANHIPRIASLIRSIPPDGGGRNDLGPDAQLPCHQRLKGFYDVYGRLRWDDVSPTITSGFVNPSKGRFLHPVQHRCLTPREGALLQTFPATYQFPMRLGKGAIALMIGNAFPPKLAEAHARAVAATL
jgi:DNA (cytosine-5)-methyltransferase 1